MICLLGLTVLLTKASCLPTLLEVNSLRAAALLNITNEVATTDCSTVDIQDIDSDIQFILYNRENQLTGIVLDDTNLNQVNPLHRVILIIHGWIEDGFQPWAIQMKDVYLQKLPANIIIVDWSAYSELNYGVAACSVPYVGQFIGDFIYTLTTVGNVPLENIQINGFSLGGHVGGFAGKQVQNSSGGSKIARINGLDAAGPGFEGRDPSERLASTDASCVQGIHTSGGTFGYKNAYGTVDFQLNCNLLGCGVFQPGCPSNPGVSFDGIDNVLILNVGCHHIRAVACFTESINSTNFIGVSCSSCPKFCLDQCASGPTAVMGEDFPCNVTGVYYLSTNAQSPFARGLPGTHP